VGKKPAWPRGGFSESLSPVFSRFDPAAASPLAPGLPVPAGRKFSAPEFGDELNCHGRKYYLGKELERAHFGAVFECSDDWGNELLAKLLRPRRRAYGTVRELWLRELQNLTQLPHPHLLHVFDAFEFRDAIYLILERCSFSLENLLHWGMAQREAWLKPLARGLLQAIDFIHSAGRLHQTIHPGNIYTRHVDGERRGPNPAISFKLGDLEMSRLQPDHRVLGTMMKPWMIPPEFLNPGEFGNAGRGVDIYQAGLVFLSLLEGCIPCFTPDEIQGGRPAEMAEALASPLAPAIAKALRPHTKDRTSSAREFWEDINNCCLE